MVPGRHTRTDNSASISGAWQQARLGRAPAACTSNPQEDGPNEDMDANDPPLENPLSKGGGGAEAPPGGGGKGGQGGSDDEEMASNDHEDNKDEEDSKESKEEDPVSGQTGKEYVPKTKKGKEIARMFMNFCRLSKSSANTIVVYFGVSTMDKLADFPEEHWKDTFVQWQKHHICPNGLERALVLSLLPEDRIRCVAWACHYPHQISWPLVPSCGQVTPCHSP